MTPEKQELLDMGVKIPEGQEEHDAWVPTAAEQRALDGGWKPEADWEGDPSEWVTAKEFNFRGDLMARITQLGRKVGALEADLSKAQKVVANSDKVTQKMVEAAYNQALTDLKGQLRAARRDGDEDAADEISDRLDELKATKKEVDSQAPAPVTQKDAAVDKTGWTPVQNAWYDFVTGTKWVQDPSVHEQLLRYADTKLTAQPDMEVGDFMEMVLDKGKELRGLKRAAPSGPDDGGAGRKKAAAGGGKFTAKDLNPMQKEFAQYMKESGDIKTLDEYAVMLGNENGLDKQRGY